MRIFLAFMAAMLLSSSVNFAQDTNDKTNTEIKASPVVKMARDFLMVQVAYNNWVQKPDSVNTKTFGYAFNTHLCYDFPINKTKLSFAAGLGINLSVVYLNQMALIDTHTVSPLNTQATFVADTNHFKKYKFATAYLTAPFELRYYGNIVNRNKGFKAAIGLEIGTLLGAHTKAVTTVDGTTVKFKTDTKRYVSPWNFAATARIGWGNFTLFGSYNLTNVFKDNAGPPITPMSLGICLSGL